MRRSFANCPRCHGAMRETKAFSGAPSEYWRECTNCNTYVNTYLPQPHQGAVHNDTHRYIGNFGGYGTGKTTTSREEVLKHILITPGGNTLIGANVQSQYDQTIRRELEADLPDAFVRDYSSQKQYIDLWNGHRIMYRPFDDPDKLRSYNLSMFVIVEASECKPEVFTQLKTRLRNLSACKPYLNEDGSVKMERHETGIEVPSIEFDWRKGIIESNPDAGWVLEDVLNVSSDIVRHGRVYDEYSQDVNALDPAIASHVASTDVNAYLPKTFIAEQVKNKPVWWINRFIYSSFVYAVGLVYPHAATSFQISRPIPRHFRHIVSHDYGLSDDSVFLFGAVDERAGLLIIYKELRTNNRSVEELAGIFLEGCKDIPQGMMLCQPLIDPKSAVKRDYEKKTLATHYEEFGVFFKPGQINLDARIYRTNTYFEMKRIIIYEDMCPALCKELRTYKFPERTLSNRKASMKPEDKNNHGINALEWICMELPSNPKDIIHGIFDRHGKAVVTQEDEARDYSYVPFAIRDDEDEESYTDSNMLGFEF